MRVDEAAKELFGEMRNLNKEEQEALEKTLDRISEDTGIRLFDTKPRKIVKIKGKITRVYKASERLVDYEHE